MVAGVAAAASALLTVGASRGLAQSYLTPSQIRSAYRFNNLPTSTNGSGQTIGIIDFGDANNIQSSLASFDSTFGIQAPASFSVVSSTGGTGLPPAGPDNTETILDVEYVHAIAPAAKIVLVEVAATFGAGGSFSYSPTNLQNATNTLANTYKASVVSMSFGGGVGGGSSETSMDPYYNRAGTAFVASSGDSGTASYPASSPYVIGVGGTTLTVTGSSNAPGLSATGGNYGGETVWNHSGGSGGGGIDPSESRPSYQSGLGTGASGQTSTTYRNTPDVAYDADPNTGVIIATNTSTGSSSGGTTSYGVVGGTSAGAPQWAGLIALADQLRVSNGLAVLSSTDALNAMYALYYKYDVSTSPSYNTATYAQYFHDVTSGATSSGYNAATGYDNATGLGTPVADNLITYLSTYAAPEPTSLALVVIGVAPLLGGRRRRPRP